MSQTYDLQSFPDRTQDPDSTLTVRVVEFPPINGHARPWVAIHIKNPIGCGFCLMTDNAELLTRIAAEANRAAHLLLKAEAVAKAARAAEEKYAQETPAPSLETSCR